MTIAHHPDASSLLAYAAGSLGEALSTVVTAHLDHCPACRREVRRLSEVGGALVTTVAPVAMRADALDRALAAVDSIGRTIAAPVPAKRTALTTVEQILGTGLDSAEWRRVAPGVQKIELKLSPAATGRLQLLRIGAGRAIPDHGHGGSEMTLVLSGAYADKFGRFGPGDVADLDADVDHEPTVELTGECICLVASEQQARFKGRLMRMLQPLFRI